MRRSIQGVVALLSVLVIAGCSTPEPESTEAVETQAAEATPSPSPSPETVEWSVPTTCEEAVTPSVQRELDAGVEQLEPLDFAGDFGDLVPAGIEGLACTNFIPNSDGLSTWALARVPLDLREETLNLAAQAGFEPRVDTTLDGVRFLTLVEPDQYSGGELQSYGSTTMLIGDAWLHIYGATAYAIEGLREMAETYGLPVDVSWALPLSCDGQAAAWTDLTADGREGAWSGYAENASSFEALAGVVGLDDVVLECAWSTDAAPSARFTADQFTMVGRLTPEGSTLALDWLLDAGWRIDAEEGDRVDVVRDGDLPGAGILIGDGLVLVEPVDAADAELVEPFAEGLGLLG